MVKRNSKRTGRRRAAGGASIFAYTVAGWFASGSVSIRAGQLDIDYTRPSRPTSLTLSLAATSTTGTYMVPSNLPTVVIALISADGDTCGFSKPILVPFGAEKSVTVRAPRTTDFGQYSSTPDTGHIITIFTLSRDSNTTISYSGVLKMLYRRYKVGIGIKADLLPEAMRKMYLTDQGDDDDEAGPSGSSSFVVN